MIIQFETAKLLKEKGFEQDIYPCYADDGKIHTWAYFSISNPNSNSYYAVEQYLIQKWLREVHNIHINIKHRPHSQSFCFTITGKYQDVNDGELVNSIFSKYKTYELALEAALQEALKLI